MKKINIILWGIILISFFGCNSFKKQNVNFYHQYYEPVKTPVSYNLMQITLTEAKKLYGKPKYPVKEVYLFRTKNRERIAEFAISDVRNWNLFTQKIKENKKIFKKFNFSKNLSIKSKLKLIQNLNNIVSGESLVNEFFFFSSNRRKSNRNYLDKILGKSVLNLPRDSSVGTGFSLTEIVDKENGIYAIYIDAELDSNLFKLLLFHEVLHLLNPDVFDWYQEGFNNCFSEYMAKKLNISWTLWEDRFLKSYRTKKGPYAIAYKMMREILEIAPNESKNIMKFVVRKSSIDIDKWLKTVPKNKRIEIRNIIIKYSKDLNKVKGRNNSFEIPMN